MHYWFAAQTVRRAVTVAAIVGPILVLINHGEALFALEVTPRLLAKILLTFLVPYVVSSYSSARALSLARTADRHSPRGRPQR